MCPVVKCVVWDVVLGIHKYNTLGESELDGNVTIDLIIVTFDICIKLILSFFIITFYVHLLSQTSIIAQIAVHLSTCSIRFYISVLLTKLYLSNICM